jgi:hypothetical protein
VLILLNLCLDGSPPATHRDIRCQSAETLEIHPSIEECRYTTSPPAGCRRGQLESPGSLPEPGDAARPPRRSNHEAVAVDFLPISHTLARKFVPGQPRLLAHTSWWRSRSDCAGTFWDTHYPIRVLMPLRGTQNPIKMGSGSSLLKLRTWHRLEAVLFPVPSSPAKSLARTSGAPEPGAPHTGSPKGSLLLAFACPPMPRRTRIGLRSWQQQGGVGPLARPANGGVGRRH